MDIFNKLVCRAKQYVSFKQFCKDWFMFNMEYMFMVWKKSKGE